MVGLVHGTFPQSLLTHLIGNGGEQGMRDAEGAVVFRALAILGAHVVYLLKVSGVGKMHLIRGDAHDGPFILTLEMMLDRVTKAFGIHAPYLL